MFSYIRQLVEHITGDSYVLLRENKIRIDGVWIQVMSIKFASERQALRGRHALVEVDHYVCETPMVSGLGDRQAVFEQIRLLNERVRAS
jgi:hypothetical protein